MLRCCRTKQHRYEGSGVREPYLVRAAMGDSRVDSGNRTNASRSGDGFGL